mmetsp:Transcript_5461/g.14757  ORF Transcript_5461/g.14757 Transcript_5461/m.14757 type:complete len:460 (-) Transcript_5461:556-1935(-)|eukprot:CAMPEP_0202355608 /NCGR_PEP_ID=MMETSP1126-20121109/10431_1 /ASSEMBLY_ACC=CAM_ASM_000457 /TAXON_ID=3047 /ORGANISM="Dunaliella tertiolecta, Strain CCMP1320" /LENGTH=459 /DNA_ID=CAMNT_0048948251 /DNA_START=28 /DNA_END=1407 /DNA_ORIENTATION=+
MEVEGPQTLDRKGGGFDELMRDQMDADDPKLPRASASYVNKDEPFHIQQRTYERQYAQLYYARLSMMRPPLEEQVARKWPGVEVLPILNFGIEHEGKDLVAIGTLYKDMKLRPSILDEYIKDRGMSTALNATSFCADDDKMILEDEGARMALAGAALPVQQLVTGIVVAVRGATDASGSFFVSDMCYPGMPDQVPRPLIEEDKYVAFISGIKLSSKKRDLIQLQMALDMLAGNLGSKEEQHLASRVVRLVVAGGCIGSLETIANQNAFANQHSVALGPVQDLDMFTTELAAALPVDIMPGAQDPTNVAMPQQPLHRCLFPSASSYGSLVRASNPHAFELDGVSFLGSSGQPVDDVVKYSRQSSRLDVMEQCLQWRHLAPTAPDTLASYPFDAFDPFIIESTPHVLFAGNQPEFGVRSIQGPNNQSVLLLELPSFEHTGTMVLLNLKTMSTHPITFGAEM